VKEQAPHKENAAPVGTAHSYFMGAAGFAATGLLNLHVAFGFNSRTLHHLARIDADWNSAFIALLQI